MDFKTYFNALTKLWQEVDLFNSGHWLCSECIENHHKKVNKKHIYDFFSGLNKDLNKVHVRLLTSKSIPSINEIFAEVRREETRKCVMLGTVKATTENSAFSIRGPENSHGESRNQKKCGNLWCDHYQRSHHSLDKC